jgi:hypothetical protein
MQIHDFIVVGSGCTGAMAAQTLAEAGKQVLILDGGITNDHYSKVQPQKNFVDLREQDENQHRYFLGDQFESLAVDDTGTGAQLTPARAHLIARVSEYLPIQSDDFKPMESLALGGLGGGWGLGCCVFSAAELTKAGLPVEAMNRAYQTIGDRIGICAANDDARKFTAAHIQNVQEPPVSDPLMSGLLHRYQKQKSALNQKGFYLGRPALALLTKAKENRRELALRDMDFYDDTEQSAWRAWITITALRKKENVSFEGGLLVTDFSEEENCVRVNAIRLETHEKISFYCRKLILSPGVLGTARIVLRSQNGGKEKKLPLLCNPYTYLPCIVPSRLGKSVPKNNFGFAQLSLFHDANGKEEDVAMASVYSYRSLLLFRLLKETPLNFRDGRIFMQHLAPAIAIAGIHHPEIARNTQYIELQTNSALPTGDQLHAVYQRGTANEEVKQREKKYASALRSLGAWPLKKVQPPIGASIHYAGLLPFSKAENSFSLAPDGRLYGTNRVYVSDGSGFTFLPAKGLTLSLMANAHLVAEAAAQ